MQVGEDTLAVMHAWVARVFPSTHLAQRVKAVGDFVDKMYRDICQKHYLEVDADCDSDSAEPLCRVPSPVVALTRRAASDPNATVELLKPAWRL